MVAQCPALAFDQSDTNKRLRAVCDALCELADEHQYAPEDVTLDQAEDAEVLAAALEAGLQRVRETLASRRGSRARHFWARALADEVRA